MNSKHLRLTKGVHIVFSRERFPLTQAIYFDVPDGRMIFAIPRGRSTYVGTTDTFYEANLNRVVATKQDAKYLVDAVNNMFPTIKLTQEDIESNWAGLRPLIHEDGKDPSELSRKDEIFISDTGLISIAGGKLTGYRKMAQRVIETVLKTMDVKKREQYPKSRSRHITLTSHPLEDFDAVEQYLSQLNQELQNMGVKDRHYGLYLVTNYGRQSDMIIQKTNYFLNEDVEARLIRSEVWYGVHHEMVNGLSDFFVRRTGRLYFDIHSLFKYRSIVQEDLIKYLGWDEKRLEKESKYLDLLVQDATTYYKEEIT